MKHLELVVEDFHGVVVVMGQHVVEVMVVIEILIDQVRTIDYI
jgi:hypothetical protein